MSENRLIHSRRVFSGRIVKVDVDRVSLANGNEVELEIIRHPGAAAVVPVISDNDPDPTVLMLRQFRHAAGGTIWEIPAGVLEPGEDPRDCAVRELMEETGARANKMKPLSTVFTTPGFTDERIHLFLATGLEMGTPRLENDEQIEVVPTKMSEVIEMVQNGTVCDAKSVSALLLAHLSLRFQ
jgi:ADP-ribose diphosphatase